MKQKLEPMGIRWKEHVQRSKGIKLAGDQRCANTEENDNDLKKLSAYKKTCADKK